MTTSRTDLLPVTRSLIRGAMLLDLIVMAILAIVLIGLLFSSRSPNFVGTLATMSPEDALFAARVGVAGAFIVGALLLPLTQAMLRIVDSARSGDPFVPENGQRLRRIAWLLLAINIVTNVTISVALAKGVRLPPVSFTAVLTVLMIFVIARIFETGSAMRAELQETV